MRYRKPRTLNWVSFALVIAAGLFAYVLVCLWPVYLARSKAKGILLDHVPLLYRANLRPADVSQVLLTQIRTSVDAELKKAGINEKAAKLYLRHNPKEIELELRFKAKAHFPFPDKTYEFDLAPKVVSDATRVDW
jgi:hypothetical protein